MAGLEALDDGLGQGEMSVAQEAKRLGEAK
jgi:hypothetical protein